MLGNPEELLSSSGNVLNPENRKKITGFKKGKRVFSTSGGRATGYPHSKE